MKKKILCIIPARKGSKGLKNKNYLIFDKKPLIYYPLLIASKISLINKIVFSTDSQKYANYVKKKFNNVDIRFRNKKLSSDTAKTFDVIKDIIQAYKKEKESFDVILLLEPTSPLTNTTMVNNAISLLEKKYDTIDSVIPVVNLPKFEKTFLINIKNKIFSGTKFPNNTRRQVKNAFFLSGNFYMSKVSSYLKNKGFYSNKTHAYYIDKKFYSDIDDYNDFKIAEYVKKNSKIF
jgi:CMP-N-acetylneuraminic acid synthetase